MINKTQKFKTIRNRSIILSIVLFLVCMGIEVIFALYTNDDNGNLFMVLSIITLFLFGSAIIFTITNYSLYYANRLRFINLINNRNSFSRIGKFKETKNSKTFFKGLVFNEYYFETEEETLVVYISLDLFDEMPELNAKTKIEIAENFLINYEKI